MDRNRYEKGWLELLFFNLPSNDAYVLFVINIMVSVYARELGTIRGVVNIRWHAGCQTESYQAQFYIRIESLA